MSRSQETTEETRTAPPSRDDGAQDVAEDGAGDKGMDSPAESTHDTHPAPAPQGENLDSEEAGALRRELDELNDRHLRLAAEFDNFRRRSRTEMGESGVRAQAHLVAGIVDVLDDFERVGTLDPEQATVQSVLEGVQLMEQKLQRALQDAGLEVVDPGDETFDPNAMEAMMKVPTDSPHEDGQVAQVFQKGFRFKGHLLRPARVSVRVHE